MQSNYEFRSIIPGVETLSSRISMPRHHHDEGYATVVLSGCVTEVSFAGRMHAGPGDVFLHGRFDCHLDRVHSGRALQILRLPWPHNELEGLYRVADPDSLVRLAATDARVAAAALHEQIRPCESHTTDWVDEIAETLARGSAFRLQDWAERRGLRADAVSRVFRREFGVSPKRFRLEWRTRLAWREIVGSQRSLTEIALSAGFSDLAHLSRSINAFTGRCPRAWRTKPS
ncbi:MAG: helix-turn-helix transcriptional regulator [Chloroflexi bacterium]|nr:helix-turn-helix transcriptional regulator [Chloroflexota bacterium]